MLYYKYVCVMGLSACDFLEMNSPLTTTNIQEGSEEPKKYLQAYKAKGETT